MKLRRCWLGGVITLLENKNHHDLNLNLILRLRSVYPVKLWRFFSMLALF